MFFHSLYDLERIAVIGVLAYVTLIVMLRFTGKRTLSKMNAFDLIVTVALGSTLSAAILNNQVSLVECALALALLCALQYVVTFTSVRSQMFAKSGEIGAGAALFRRAASFRRPYGASASPKRKRLRRCAVRASPISVA